QGLCAGQLRRDKALPLQQVQRLLRRSGVPHGIAAVRSQGAGEGLCHQQLAHIIAAAGAAGGVKSGEQLNPPRRVLADIVRQLRVPQGLIQPAGVHGPQGQKTQHPGAGSRVPQDAEAVPGVDLRRLLPPLKRYLRQLLPQVPVRLGDVGELQIPRPEDPLVLGLPEIEAVAVDEVLYHRVNEGGDVPSQVDVLPDAGGADVFQMGGQLQLDDAAGDAAQICVDLPSLRVAGAAEDDVVHGVDGPRHRCRLVGGGVGYHVRAHRQVQLPAGKDLPQPVQVLRRGQVHWDVVGEEVHVELVRHGHADDLPPHQGGLRLLGPGELVDGQIHLHPQIPDLLDDALVAQGEGVEGAGKEGGPCRHVEGEVSAFNLIGDDEAVDVG
ncbi:DUF4406 domain-containing protein, partial [Dysosmobacter welbionis]